MLASISTRSFDIDGDQLLRLEGDSDISNMARRVVRTKTLDGGIIMSDGGFNLADPVITLNFRVSEQVDAKLRLFVQIHPLLTLATRFGVFLGAVGTYTVNGATGIATLRFSAIEELT